jgi:FkbM family methyltransferase
VVDEYEMEVEGVLHLGAHLAEEAQAYTKLFPGVPVWWVEANPHVFQRLKPITELFGQKLIQALVYSKDDERIPFNITNYDGMSSSIYQFGTHTSFSPDTVFVDHMVLPTRTVDSLAEEFGIKANFLNMDLQGAELHALLGATEFLKGVDYINTEVNSAEVYVGCCKIEQLDALLLDFERVETNWVPDQGWGDSFYLRRDS